MIEFRYSLQLYKGIKSRFKCPNCKVNGVFTRYIDNQTGDIRFDVGRCSREVNCGFHYSPQQFFIDNKEIIPRQILNINRNKLLKISHPSYLGMELVEASLRREKLNNFIDFLKSKFGEVSANHLALKYKIGTAKYWMGSTVFWQIDSTYNVRSGKVMLYNSFTGSRIKEPFNHITWVHKVLKKKDFNLKQCFFGEHLINDNNQPIAIVESEKTAVIASFYLPQFVWLAAGSISNLNPEKFKILKNRNVVLFPDLKAYDRWNQIAKAISNNLDIRVSNYLEINAKEEDKMLGLDLADYLLKYNKSNF